MIDKVPAIIAMMKYRDWIFCNETIGWAMMGDRNCPKYKEDVKNPTDLPLILGFAKVITQSLIDGINSPIPAPANKAQNRIIGYDGVIWIPKKPIANNPNEREPNLANEMIFLSLGIKKEVMPPHNVARETMAPALAGESMPYDWSKKGNCVGMQ